MIALKEGNTKIAKLILEQKDKKTTKALLEERDNDEQNVFHYAFASRTPVEATQVLVDSCYSTFADNYPAEMRDFLTSKDLNEVTPIHTLVLQQLQRIQFDKIFVSLSSPQRHEGADSLEGGVLEHDHQSEDISLKMKTQG